MTNDSKSDPTPGAAAQHLTSRQVVIGRLDEIGEASELGAIADVVDEASNDSFPASDPPGWTLGVDSK